MERAQGSIHASVILEEYGDYECPMSARAHDLIGELLDTFGTQVRFVFRNFPLSEHAHAERAAQAAESAGEQGKFWEMQNLLFRNPGRLRLVDLVDYAERLGLDVERFEEELTNHAHMGEVAHDLHEGRRRGVRGTPEFFINGARYEGPIVLEPLREAIQSALDQELIRRAI